MTLSKRSAARLIGRSERTLRYWTERGYLPRRELDDAGLPRLKELSRIIRPDRPPKGRGAPR